MAVPVPRRSIRLQLVGALVMAAGTYGGFVELSHPPANLARLVLFAALLLVGALIMEPRVARALRHGTEAYRNVRRGDATHRGGTTLQALREAGYTLRPRDKTPSATSPPGGDGR